MSSYNDAWFMNESLAFYLSTSTFINPLFDSMVQDDSSSVDNSTRNHQLDDDTSGCTKNAREVNYPNHWSLNQQNRCLNFCDNIAYTFRSKMYVLKLDFKKIFQRLRRFTDKRMPCWLLPKHVRSSNRSAGSGGGDFGCPQPMEADHSVGGDRFWFDNVGEPNTRESLGLQKVKILSRLEQAIEEKRNNNNNNKQLLFNMNDHGGLPFVRPIGTRNPGRGHRQKGSSSSLSLSSHSSSSSYSSSSSCNSGSSKNGSKIKINDGVAPSTRSANKRGLRLNFSIGQQQQQHQQLPQGAQVDAGSSNKKLCVICYTNSPNIVTLPCKHHEICSDCFIELIYVAVKHSQYPLKCVLCRQKIEKIRCSRGLLLSVIKKNRIIP